MARGLTSRDARAARLELHALRARRCGDDPWRQLGVDRAFAAPAIARASRAATEGARHDEA